MRTTYSTSDFIIAAFIIALANVSYRLLCVKNNHIIVQFNTEDILGALEALNNNGNIPIQNLLTAYHDVKSEANALKDRVALREVSNE
jgi:hypothetical protein